MVEKFAASFAAVLAIVLGIWTRITFVRRSEIYAKDGQPVYQHTANCKQMQQACNKTICNKIEEIKAVQLRADKNRDDAREVLQAQLAAIQQFMGRVEQYIKDHK